MRAPLLLVFLLGCPSPVTPPSPDASDASFADVVPLREASPSPPATADAGETDKPTLTCLHLLKLGCSEACDGGLCFGDQSETCAGVVRHAFLTRATELALDCVIAATSGAEVRKCGAAWKDACGGPPAVARDGGRQ